MMQITKKQKPGAVSERRFDISTSFRQAGEYRDEGVLTFAQCGGVIPPFVACTDVAYILTVLEVRGFLNPFVTLATVQGQKKVSAMRPRRRANSWNEAVRKVNHVFFLGGGDLVTASRVSSIYGGSLLGSSILLGLMWHRRLVIMACFQKAVRR